MKIKIREMDQCIELAKVVDKESKDKMELLWALPSNVFGTYIEAQKISWNLFEIRVTKYEFSFILPLLFIEYILDD